MPSMSAGLENRSVSLEGFRRNLNSHTYTSCNRKTSHHERLLNHLPNLIPTQESLHDIMAGKDLSTIAALGLDFGCLSSKMTLAFKLANGRPQALRVTLTADLAHPERWNTPAASNSLAEFIACAALEGGRLVPGRQSLTKDQSFPLKTIFTHRALSRHSTISAMPGGDHLLQAVSECRITPDMEDDVLREHFSLLRDMAIEKANTAKLVIRTIVLTYPNYLCNNEQKDDFPRYKLYYLELIRPIWSEYDQNITFEMVSEGQAAALYICEPFDDPLYSFSRTRLWRTFEKLNKRDGLNLVVPDSGSSTLNIQLQSVYFDDQGGVCNSQSSVGPRWRTGSQGGSHVSNGIIQEHVRSQLRAHVPQGEFATIMQRFEEQKWSLDYTHQTKPIVLIGNNPRFTVHIAPVHIRNAFEKAFQRGLQVLKAEISRIVRLGKDFAVVFCGGSYCSPGLRQQVDDIMSGIVKDASKKKIRVEHAFLANFDTTWVSAVATGAALSIMRLPSLTQVISGSAIALQRVMRRRQASKVWTGDDHAKILFRDWNDVSPSPDFSNPSKTRLRTYFSLVCDPNHSKRDQPDGYGERGLIRIDSPKKVLNGPLSVYDLGWEIPAEELPIGPIRFHIDSRALTRLADLDDEADLLKLPPPKSEDEPEHDRRSVTIGLSCCKELVDRPLK
ncbi:hypothetical protein F5Y12DRAFT_38789 [Xylaria sp. FL1777]|nr:hypothetical protein F5Y12DRAFT_38789 [Xylaria sp. FL1777]